VGHKRTSQPGKVPPPDYQSQDGERHSRLHMEVIVRLKNDLWAWFDGLYKVHCNSYDAYRRISAWKGCTAHGVYSMPDGSVEWDVIVPEECLDDARQVLGLNAESQTLTLPRKPVKGDNDLRNSKSTQGASNEH